MQEALFDLLGLNVTAYALCVAFAALAGFAVFMAAGRKMGLKASDGFDCGLCTFAGAFIGARLCYVLARLSFYLEIGLEHGLYFWEGGYLLFGALGGGALALVLCSRVKHLSCGRCMDAAAIASALVIALCRFAEYFSGEGKGPEIGEEGPLCFFPVAVFNDQYESWFFAVFMLEGLTALVIGFILLRKKRAPGNTARLFVLLFCACQVVLESVRRDNYPRWLFVRVSQLAAVLVLFGLMVVALARRLKTEKYTFSKHALPLIVLVLLCGVCVALEFAIDKSADLPNTVAYTFMTLCCVGMGITAYKLIRPV